MAKEVRGGATAPFLLRFHNANAIVIKYPAKPMTLAETNNDKGFLAFLALQALEDHLAKQHRKLDHRSESIVHEALWDALDRVQIVSA